MRRAWILLCFTLILLDMTYTFPRPDKEEKNEDNVKIKSEQDDEEVDVSQLPKEHRKLEEELGIEIEDLPRPQGPRHHPHFQRYRRPNGPRLPPLKRPFKGWPLKAPLKKHRKTKKPLNLPAKKPFQTRPKRKLPPPPPPPPRSKPQRQSPERPARRESSYNAPVSQPSYSAPSEPEVIIKQAGPSQTYGWIGNGNYFPYNIPNPFPSSLPKWVPMGNNVYQVGAIYSGSSSQGPSPAVSQPVPSYSAPSSSVVQSAPSGGQQSGSTYNAGQAVTGGSPVISSGNSYAGPSSSSVESSYSVGSGSSQAASSSSYSTGTSQPASSNLGSSYSVSSSSSSSNVGDSYSAASSSPSNIGVSYSVGSSSSFENTNPTVPSLLDPASSSYSLPNQPSSNYFRPNLAASASINSGYSNGNPFASSSSSSLLPRPNQASSGYVQPSSPAPAPRPNSVPASYGSLSQPTSGGSSSFSYSSPNGGNVFTSVQHGSSSSNYNAAPAPAPVRNVPATLGSYSSVASSTSSSVSVGNRQRPLASPRPNVNYGSFSSPSPRPASTSYASVSSTPAGTPESSYSSDGNEDYASEANSSPAPSRKPVTAPSSSSQAPNYVSSGEEVDTYDRQPVRVWDPETQTFVTVQNPLDSQSSSNAIREEELRQGSQDPSVSYTRSVGQTSKYAPKQPKRPQGSDAPSPSRETFDPFGLLKNRRQKPTAEPKAPEVEETEQEDDDDSELFYIFYEDEESSEDQAPIETSEVEEPQRDIYQTAQDAQVEFVIEEPSNSQFKPPSDDDILTIYVPLENAINVPESYSLNLGTSFGYNGDRNSPRERLNGDGKNNNNFPNFRSRENRPPPSYDNPISSYDAPLYNDNSYTAKVDEDDVNPHRRRKVRKVRRPQSSVGEQNEDDEAESGAGNRKRRRERIQIVEEN